MKQFSYAKRFLHGIQDRLNSVQMVQINSISNETKNRMSHSISNRRSKKSHFETRRNKKKSQIQHTFIHLHLKLKQLYKNKAFHYKSGK